MNRQSKFSIILVTLTVIILAAYCARAEAKKNEKSMGLILLSLLKYNEHLDGA